MSAREDAIRKLLNERRYKNGLTVNQVAEKACLPLESTREYLRKMPDVYVHRWLTHIALDGSLISRRPSAVYRAVPVPADCPPPPKKEERLRMKKS